MTDVLMLKEFEQTVDRTAQTAFRRFDPDRRGLSTVIPRLCRSSERWSLLDNPGWPPKWKVHFSPLKSVYFLEKGFPNQCNLTLIPFKRGPLSQIGTNDHRHLVLGQDTANETLNHFAETIKTNTDVMHILLMDDLGIAFSSGNNALITALNQFGDQLNIMSHDNFMVVIADLYGNLKSPQTYNSSFLKLFQQSQAGVFYSMDESDMQWFNAPISLQQKKSLKWLPGRGFYVTKGKAEFIQSPLITPESIV